MWFNAMIKSIHDEPHELWGFDGGYNRFCYRQAFNYDNRGYWLKYEGMYLTHCNIPLVKTETRYSVRQNSGYFGVMRREYFWTLEEAQKAARSYAEGIVGFFYHPKDGYVDIPYRWQNPKRLGDFKISLARRAGAYMYKDSKGKKTYVSGKMKEADPWRGRPRTDPQTGCGTPGRHHARTWRALPGYVQLPQQERGVPKGRRLDRSSSFSRRYDQAASGSSADRSLPTANDWQRYAGTCAARLALEYPPATPPV